MYSGLLGNEGLLYSRCEREGLGHFPFVVWFISRRVENIPHDNKNATSRPSVVSTPTPHAPLPCNRPTSPRLDTLASFSPQSALTTMSPISEAPDKPPEVSRTPSSIASELSKLDLPAPTQLRLNLPKTNLLSPVLDSAISPTSPDTGDLSGPEPEAITLMRRKTRSESMSEQLSATLSQMTLPQPERIFGPNEGGSPAAREEPSGKQGVSPDDWDKVKLQDEVPEAVKEPVRMTHSRNVSRS